MHKAALILVCGLVLAVFSAPGVRAQSEPDSTPEAFTDSDGVDWQAYRVAYDALRTKYYDKGSYARALAAARTIFELADEEYEVAVADNGVVAHRTWMTMLGEDPGEAWWYVAIGTAADGRIVVRARMSPEPDPLGPADLSSGRVEPLSPELINPVETTTYELTGTDGAVGLFLMRMDWIMGVNPYWLYCNAAVEYAKIEPWQGSLDAFCRQSDDVRADRVPLNLPK